jgi:hypothetical protein
MASSTMWVSLRWFWVDCRQDRCRRLRATRYGSSGDACPSSALPWYADTGLAHRAGLIRSLSAIWRDPSQICRSVTPSRPVPTFGPRPGKEHEAVCPCRQRWSTPSSGSTPTATPRRGARGLARYTDRDDADRQRQCRIYPAARRGCRGGAGTAVGGLAGEQPQLRVGLARTRGQSASTVCPDYPETRISDHSWRGFLPRRPVQRTRILDLRQGQAVGNR